MPNHYNTKDKRILDKIHKIVRSMKIIYICKTILKLFELFH